jgi:hypothetical protein
MIPSKRNKSSNKDAAASAFSEANCGSATTDYHQSLARRGLKYTKDTITMVRQRQEAIQNLKNAPAEDLKPKCGRALLCKFVFLAVRSTTTDSSDTGRIFPFHALYAQYQYHLHTNRFPLHFPRPHSAYLFSCFFMLLDPFFLCS